MVDERPGVSLAELASASGIEKRTLYAVLRTLRDRGEVERRELPGGITGYGRPKQRSDDTTPAVAGDAPLEAATPSTSSHVVTETDGAVVQPAD